MLRCYIQEEKQERKAMALAEQALKKLAEQLINRTDWVAVRTEDGTGAVYYHNEKTVTH